VELRIAFCLPLLLACTPIQPKHLIIPEEMKRPLATGQSVSEATGSKKIGSVDRFVVGSDDPARIAPGSPAAPGPGPVAGTASPKAPAAPQRLVSPKVPTQESQRYTLRLVERGRVWELELPESTGGYEVRIPLGAGIETPTAADQEMLAGKTPPEGRSKSYLATLAKLGEMYSAHRYELALIEVVDLEQQYPKDPRLLAMKGSLYQKLGKAALAREAWKKALEIDPSDTIVAEALRALKEE